MGDCERSDDANRTTKIRELNDGLRCHGKGRRVMLTRAVAALSPEIVERGLAAIRAFDSFTARNDPYGEHDFGQVDVDGHAMFWKIDYYDVNLEFGSPDPADETVTCRVMTIMTAQDL